MPAGSAVRSDTFELYAAAASGLLEVCGLAQPGEFWSEQTSQAADDDEDDDGWAGFLAAVWAVRREQAWDVGTLIAACRDWDNQGGQHIRAALPGGLASDLSSGRREPGDVAKSLGWWLRNHEGQWTAGRLVVRCVGGGKGGHPKKWAVRHRPVELIFG
jgi:hypothetical protein